MFNERTETNASSSAKKFNLTPEQIIFIVGKRKLAAYEEIEKERPLTMEEYEAKRLELTRMFSVLSRYIYSLIRKTEGRFMNVQESKAEILNDCYFIFDKKLRKYDPFLTTPTTYFKKDLQGVISSYIRNSNAVSLTKKDTDNVAKVKRAIRYYESIGCSWNEEMNSRATKISV